MHHHTLCAPQASQTVVMREDQTRSRICSATACRFHHMRPWHVSFPGSLAIMLPLILLLRGQAVEMFTSPRLSQSGAICLHITERDIAESFAHKLTHSDLRSLLHLHTAN